MAWALEFRYKTGGKRELRSGMDISMFVVSTIWVVGKVVVYGVMVGYSTRKGSVMYFLNSGLRASRC